MTMVDAGSVQDASTTSPGTLCDGSEDVRLGYTSEGGQVDITYEFTNPYGHSFFFIDGQCRFYASSGLLQGVHTGSLTQAQSEQLMTAVHWEELAELSAAPEIESCPDAGGSTIWTRDSTTMCTCGCDDGPLAEAKDAAIMRAYEWIAMLEALGAPLTGPLSVIANERGVAENSQPAWPLDRAMTEIEFLVQDIYGEGVGQPALFDVPAETTELRALRAAVAPTFGEIAVREAGIAYTLHLRDELPDDARAAIAALLARHRP
jgi:hypothetical protein